MTDYDFSSELNTSLFIDNLKAQLQNGLPGVEAHLRLAPAMRIADLKTGSPPDSALESAVLILLYPSKGRLHTVVILRNEYDGAHSGQISLPGGKAEESDPNFQHTALRETFEEIGIHPDLPQVIGQLSTFYVRPSNYIVYPFIAWLPEQPNFHPDTTEVQRIIEIDLFNETTYKHIIHRTLTFKNHYQVEAPGFLVDGEFLWGATAMIFSELIDILSKTILKLTTKS